MSERYKFLTLDEVAQMLDLSKKAVYQMTFRGELYANRMGGIKIRFERDYIKRLLNKGTTKEAETKASLRNKAIMVELKERADLIVSLREGKGEIREKTWGEIADLLKLSYDKVIDIYKRTKDLK